MTSHNKTPISDSRVVEETEVPADNQDTPLIVTAREANGKLVMPKEWRDEDDEEGEDDY